MGVNSGQDSSALCSCRQSWSRRKQSNLVNNRPAALLTSESERSSVAAIRPGPSGASSSTSPTAALCRCSNVLIFCRQAGARQEPKRLGTRDVPSWQGYDRAGSSTASRKHCRAIDSGNPVLAAPPGAPRCMHRGRGARRGATWGGTHLDVLRARVLAGIALGVERVHHLLLTQRAVHDNCRQGQAGAGAGTMRGKADVAKGELRTQAPRTACARLAGAKA